MNLTAAQEKFVLHWGEMGTKWGINRSVAQVHALLFIAAEPLSADTIVETLSLARSNVSTSLRELQSWGIVRTVHVLGDRRDHFESLADVWDMFMKVMDERMRREVDPTIQLLEECLAETRKNETETRDRLNAMHAFFVANRTWYGQIRRLPRKSLVRFVRMGSKVAAFVGASQ